MFLRLFFRFILFAFNLQDIKMGKPSAVVWKAFSTEDCEIKFAKCLYCGELVSRGSDDPRKQNTTNLNNHMKKDHMKEWNELKMQAEQVSGIYF